MAISVLRFTNEPWGLVVHLWGYHSFVILCFLTKTKLEVLPFFNFKPGKVFFEWCATRFFYFNFLYLWCIFSITNGTAPVSETGVKVPALRRAYFISVLFLCYCTYLIKYVFYEILKPFFITTTFVCLYMLFFSHCCDFQQDKYLTSFNFCSFDPQRFPGLNA